MYQPCVGGVRHLSTGRGLRQRTRHLHTSRRHGESVFVLPSFNLCPAYHFIAKLLHPLLLNHPFCVKSSRSSLPLLSQAEYRALNDVFPQESLRMNSTKSMIGHLLGGAGAVEAVATIKAIETGGCMCGVRVIVRCAPQLFACCF